MEESQLDNWPTPSDFESHWRETATGNFLLLTGYRGDYDGTRLGTVFKTKKGWSGISNEYETDGLYLRGDAYPDPVTAADRLCAGINSGELDAGRCAAILRGAAVAASGTGSRDDWTPAHPGGWLDGALNDGLVSEQRWKTGTAQAMSGLGQLK